MAKTDYYDYKNNFRNNLPTGVTTDGYWFVANGKRFNQPFEAERYYKYISKFDGWTPAALFASGEAGVWYDPSDLSSMNTLSDQTGSTPGVGDPVGYIADKSGNDNHATQATSASRPVLRQTAGGLYYLDFDGVDDDLTVGVQSWFNQHTGTSVAAFSTDTSGDQTIFGNRTEVEGKGLLLRNTLANVLYTHIGASSADAGGISASQSYVVTGQGDGTSISAAIDGAAFSPTASSYHTSVNALAIGQDGNGTQYFDGRIFGMVMTNDNLSSDERSKTESYLAGKSGVTL